MSTFKFVMNYVSLFSLPIIIIFVLVFGVFKRQPVYEVFVDGAKDGIKTGVKIFPYLLAIMVAIGMLRASGTIELVSTHLSWLLQKIHTPADVVPIMIVRSLSGSAVLGVLADIVNQTGINSFATKLGAIMAGSSETTFYVLSVYFGSVGIKKFRYALLVGILADVIGIIAAICVASFMFL